MRNIDIYDFFLLLGRINAGVHLSEVAQKDIDEIEKGIQTTCHDSKIPIETVQNILKKLSFSEQEIEQFSWPPASINQWKKIFTEVDRKVRSGNVETEKFWRCATSLGYTLWAPLPESNEILEPFRILLSELGIEDSEINSIIQGLSSKDDLKRIESGEKIREVIRRHDNQGFQPYQESISNAIMGVIDLYKTKDAKLERIYAVDLLKTLEEIIICFENGCYIAVMALAGKVLEISLKQILIDEKINFDDSWMIGTLIKKIKGLCPERYLDQSIGNIANIINQSRIPAVHAKEKIPIPSEDQARMVIYATLDTLKRMLQNS